jgi:hypothetical protein
MATAYSNAATTWNSYLVIYMTDMLLRMCTLELS